jgi:hypothetical protein
MRLIHDQIEYVHNRAADVLLPRKYYAAVANSDNLIFDSVGETGIVADHDFHGQLAFRIRGNCESAENTSVGTQGTDRAATDQRSRDCARTL